MAVRGEGHSSEGHKGSSGVEEQFWSGGAVLKIWTVLRGGGAIPRGNRGSSEVFRDQGPRNGGSPAGLGGEEWYGAGCGGHPGPGVLLGALLNHPFP